MFLHFCNIVAKIGYLPSFQQVPEDGQTQDLIDFFFQHFFNAAFCPMPA
jgi:hypothetical protein